MEGEFAGLLVFGAVAAVWVLVPFLERRAGSGRVTRFFTGLGIFVIGYIVVLSALALR